MLASGVTYTAEAGGRKLFALSVARSKVKGGSSLRATITLNGAAPSGGVTVLLKSSDAVLAAAPASVTVPEGATSVTFEIATTRVSSSTQITISATHVRSRTAELTVLPENALMEELNFGATSVSAGGSSQGKVILNDAAPPGGVVVSLSSSDLAIATVPASVTVREGESVATFTVVTSFVSGTASVDISASDNGVNKTTTLTATDAPEPSTSDMRATAIGRQLYVAPDGSAGGDGSLNRPWNLATALSKVLAGDTVHLRGGTYYTGATFGTSADTWYCSRSGSPDAPVNIQALGADRPVIRGEFKITASYVRVAGLIFEGGLSRDPSSAGERRADQVEVKGCHHVVLEGDEVRYSDYHAGVALSGVSEVRLVRCYIHDNGRFTVGADPVTGSQTTGVDHGVYWGSSGGGGNEISNCVVERNRGYGLQLYPRASDIEVSQNTLVGNGNSGLVVSSESDRVRVADNIAALNGRNKQIRILSGNNNVVSNNVAWSPTSSLSGIENKTSSIVTGTMIFDPRLTDVANHNFHLRADSPAIDKGIALPQVKNDFDGVFRPQGIALDVGAFEVVQR